MIKKYIIFQTSIIHYKTATIRKSFATKKAIYMAFKFDFFILLMLV